MLPAPEDQKAGDQDSAGVLVCERRSTDNARIDHGPPGWKTGNDQVKRRYRNGLFRVVRGQARITIRRLVVFDRGYRVLEGITVI